MTESASVAAVPGDAPVQPINTSYDLGALVFEDSQSYAGLTEKETE